MGTIFQLKSYALHFVSFSPTKSSGLDELNVNVIKSVYDIIQPYLHHIFKLSFKYGIVPDCLKIARVTPIYKSGDESKVINYRPISILPCFSKLLELIMYNRLYKYLIDNELLYKKQFGFQTGHSTSHAVLELGK